MMNTGHLVSCIVPIYNGEKWLKECIKSLLDQTYKNIEILLINDGSVDASEKICLQAQKKDDRIRYYSHSNQGVSFTRNRGITLSEGEYLCFVDCDDMLDKKAIESLVNAIEAGAAQLAVGAIKTISKHGSIYFGFESCVLDLGVPDDKLLRFIFEMRSPSGYMAAKLYKNRIIKDHNLRFDPNIYYHEDAIFAYEYIRHCKRCVVTDEVVYLYNCMNENSATKAFLTNRDKRYVWEAMKTDSQIALLENAALSKQDTEYVLQSVYRQFCYICSYYAELSPKPQEDLGRIQACYAPLLKKLDDKCAENPQYKLLYMPPQELFLQVLAQKKTKARPPMYRRILAAIKRKLCS